MTRVHEKVIQSMDLKKGQAPSLNMAEKANVAEFFSEVKAEIKRIDWTSPDELKAYTKIVIASMFAFGFGIYVIDLVIRACLNGFSHFIKFLVG